MKKCLLILLICASAWGYDANDANLVDLTAVTTTTSTDLLYILVDSEGTPLDRAITRNNLLDNWVGDVNVTTLGTIATGTWNATKIDISSYTNLSVTAPVLLTGDTLSVDTAVPSEGDTTHLSTAGQIWSYIDDLEIAGTDPNSHDAVTYDTNMATIFSLTNQVMEVNLISPANGRDDALSTADDIYDWVISLGYLTTVDISSNTNLAGGDGITLADDTINFDGGAVPTGDLSGSWEEPAVVDDSHSHTGATISNLDISDDTNFSVGDTVTLDLTLTDDTVTGDVNTTKINTTLSIDDIWTWSGFTVGDVNLPAFTGSIITDGTTLNIALQDVEDALGAIEEKSAEDSNTFTWVFGEDTVTGEVLYQDSNSITFSEDASGLIADVNETYVTGDIWTILGVTPGDVNFGNFTGSTFPAGQTVQQLFQYAETAIEEGGGGGASGSLFYTFPITEPNVYYDTSFGINLTAYKRLDGGYPTGQCYLTNERPIMKINYTA